MNKPEELWATVITVIFMLFTFWAIQWLMGFLTETFPVP